MRLKDYDTQDGKRVWLSEREIQQFLDEAQGPRQRAAFLLGVRCGLRRDEILEVRPAHLHETEIGQVLRIWHGKGDKYREVPVPVELATIITTLADQEDVGNARVVGTEHGSTIYRWVQGAGERLREETGDPGWSEIGPHDLRRSWGIRALEAGVLPSVVFEWGGWDDWQTFRDHYLAEFSPEALRRERAKVEWLRENDQTLDSVNGPGKDYQIVENM